MIYYDLFIQSFLGIHGSVLMWQQNVCVPQRHLQRRRFLALALITDDKIRSLVRFHYNLFFLTSHRLLPLSIYTSYHLFFQPACLCLILYLFTCQPIYFLKRLLLSVQPTVSFRLYPPIITPSVGRPLSVSYSSFNLSLLISHLPDSPSVSTWLLRAGRLPRVVFSSSQWRCSGGSC